MSSSRPAVVASIVVLLSALGAAPVASEGAHPRVLLSTSMGDLTLELYPERAPATVGSFLHYVRTGYYDGTIFHRVVRGFIVQGGGMTPGLREKEGRTGPIQNESANGLGNDAGTVAMARKSAPDTATSEFFINLRDNSFLNRDAALDGAGYAVFGRVVGGMEVLRRMERVKTSARGRYPNVPVEPIVVESVRVLGE